MDVRVEPSSFALSPHAVYRFNASRYPTKPSDTAQKFDPSTHNHVVFVRKNKFYEIDVVQDGRELSLSELENQIRQIYETAGDTLGTPIGALTAENRDIWTDVCCLLNLKSYFRSFNRVGPRTSRRESNQCRVA